MKTEVYWIEGNWSGRLSIVARPRGGDWLEDEIETLKESAFDVLVSLLEKEEADELGLNQEKNLAEKHGLTFISFPIVDRSVPSSKEDTLKLIDRLSQYLTDGKNVAIHCRQSVGRSSLISASLLISAGFDIESALQRVGTARGCVVPETKEQKEWLDFISEFLSRC